MFQLSVFHKELDQLIFECNLIITEKNKAKSINAGWRSIFDNWHELVDDSDLWLADKLLVLKRTENVIDVHRLAYKIKFHLQNQRTTNPSELMNIGFWFGIGLVSVYKVLSLTF